MARPGAFEYNNFMGLRFLMSVNLKYLLVIQFWAREQWNFEIADGNYQGEVAR